MSLTVLIFGSAVPRSFAQKPPMRFRQGNDKHYGAYSLGAYEVILQSIRRNLLFSSIP